MIQGKQLPGLVITLLAVYLLVRYAFRLEGASMNYCVGLTAFFTVFCLGIFAAGNLTAASTDRYLFARIFLISVSVKMAFFLFIVVLAIRKFGVVKEDIIIPSLLIYVLFTIIETRELMLISKKKA